MIKKKILIIEKFGLLELMFLFFFIFKFNKIYYLEKNIRLSFNFLKLLKIYQLDYEKLIDYESDLLIKVKRNIDKVLNFLKKQKKYYQFLDNHKDFEIFESAYLKNIYNEVLSITKVIEFSKKFSNPNKKIIYIYTDKIRLFTLLNETSNKNIYISQINKFKFTNLRIIFKVFQKIFSFLNLFLGSINQKKSLYKKLITIYFPHKGIYYGELYLKNQFYDKDINSIFFPKKIIHSSFDFEGNLDRFSSKYYKNKNIPYQNWSLGKYDKFLFISFFFSHKHLNSLRFNNEFDYNLAKVIFKYHYHKQILNNKFSQIKYCLINYDFLFPSELLIALNQRNILSISYNDRIIQSYWYIGSPVSYILANGNPIIKNSKYNHISNFILSGPIRLSMFLQNKNSLNKLSTLKKRRFLNSKICLVLDWESVINEYDNKQKFINNWKNMYTFYYDIYKIALRNKDIIFLIKGKTNNSLKISFYDDIFFKLFNLKNVSFINNKDKLHNTYNALYICDYLIALHTSLIDEAIFIEKKLIIYDKFNLLNKMNYYTKSILIRNDDELVQKSSILFNNSNKIKKLIKMNKKNIFGDLTIKKINKKYDIFKKQLDF